MQSKQLVSVARPCPSVACPGLDAAAGLDVASGLDFVQSACALQQAGFLQLLQRLLKVDRAKLGSPASLR